MSEPRYFHFTLGPVQGFVAQARRTRDFWAGSFLLSWLAGVAMAAVRQQHGEIDFPTPPADYLDWIGGRVSNGTPPRQGAIPNRFKSICAQVPAAFDPHRVVSAVHEAWAALAEHIWQGDGLAGFASPATRAIWMRQHASFWEVTWVLTEDVNATHLLDLRKNWRSHGFDQHEPGVKCMVMEGWQELSGQERPGAGVAKFWHHLREGTTATGFKTDLGPGEHLCALAYVKRRFARHFASFAATLPTSGLYLKGWALSPGMPSVAYMAAVHWLEAVLKAGSPEEVGTLLQAARQVSREKHEWDTHIACLRQAVPARQPGNPQRQLLALDGQLFFRHVQDNPQAYDYAPEAMKGWRQALAAFGRAHPELEPAPSPYYAVLLMDGDSLGVHMSDRSKQRLIASALLAFTDGAPAIVTQHNGCLIYAGGDDVLAILPLEDALICAARLRAHYLACFEGSGIPTTLSAAVSFAHVKTPLGLVLGDIHRLLDDVAKDGAGRDGLAVRVWKTSGQVLQWAQPWKIALEGGRADGVPVVVSLARLFARDGRTGWVDAEGKGSAGRFSSKFFFKIEERLAVLAPPAKKAPPDAAAHKQAHEALLSLLAVDLWHSDTNREHISIEQAHQHMAPLLTQCLPRQRVLMDGQELPESAWNTGTLAADGALLVRFLATKGLEGNEA